MTGSYILRIVLLLAWSTLFGQVRPTAIYHVTQGARAAGADANTSLSRTVLGYVTQTHPPELRAIYGVPGSAVLSDRLPLPRDTTELWLAQGQQSYAIVRVGNKVFGISLQGTSVGPIVEVAGMLPEADLVAFSPTGVSAVLFSTTAGRLRVLSGLPETPEVIQDISASLLPEVPRVAAVSDDGGSVVLSSAGLVYQLLSDGTTQNILKVMQPASLRFSQKSSNGAIGDRDTGTLYLLNRFGVGFVAEALVEGFVGMQEVNFSKDGRYIYFTRPSHRSICSVNVSNGQLQERDAIVEPTKIDRLFNSNAFLVSGEPRRPAWLFLPDGDQ